jgi:hypothetical protein
MGIKEDLAERKAGFVSLRALLDAICEHEHVTLKEAADWLAERLYLANECPEWCELSLGRGISAITGNRTTTAWRALRHIVTNGEYASAWELDPDDIPF